MKQLFIFLLLLTSTIALPMNILEDIESGIQPYPCHLALTMKKGFYAFSSWFGTAAGAFVVEILAFNAINKAFQEVTDPLPESCYIVAACTSSLVGCLLGPRVYRVLQAPSQEDDSDL